MAAGSSAAQASTPSQPAALPAAAIPQTAQPVITDAITIPKDGNLQSPAAPLLSPTLPPTSNSQGSFFATNGRWLWPSVAIAGASVLGLVAFVMLRNGKKPKKDKRNKYDAVQE